MSESKFIPYVGLDFILKRSTTPILLEVNDHPVGLFSEESDLESLKHSTDQILNVVKRNISKGIVCFLLPDFFEINRDGHVTRQLLFPPNIDNTLLATAKEFQLVCDSLNNMGIQSLISDVNGIKTIGTACYCQDKKIDVLVRRSNHFPKKELSVFSINDIRSRSVCVDKKRLKDVLTDKFSKSIFPSQFSNNASYLIKKPRFGMASKGIERKAFSDAVECGWNNIGEKWIVEEWIEPSFHELNGWQYYFDLRVYVLNGKVESVVTRSSAFPLNAQKSFDLDWLTTTGSSAIIYNSHSGFKTDQYDKNLFDGIQKTIDLSERIVAYLDGYIGKLNTSDEFSKIPSLNELWGINGKVRTIQL